MIFLFFIDGLALFVMGVLALFLIRKNSALRITRLLPYLGLFGLLQGIAEWSRMFRLFPSLDPGNFLLAGESFSLTVSFGSLFLFGYKLYFEDKQRMPKGEGILAGLAAAGLAILWTLGAFDGNQVLEELNGFNRYFLGLSGACLSGLAMFRQAREIRECGLGSFAPNFYWAGGFFGAYGLLAGSFPPGRALVAIGLAYCLAKGFRVYDAEERQRLYNKAVTDDLTGLYNHRFFQERLEQELARSLRQNIQTSLIMLDIDYFKIYNDTHGHPAGDLLLRDLAEILRRNLRDADVVARYGGEEFAVILPNTGSQQAFEVAERIRREVEAYPFEGRELQPGGKITVSLGIATFPVDARDKGNLIKLADLALYKAKERRNQVEIYFSVLDDLKGELDSSELGIVNTVKTLITVINAVDHYTYGHSERVVAYAEKIAKKLGLPEQEIKLVKYGAFLHDIGKIEIDRQLLSKKGVLTHGEKQALRQHPVLGAEIIRPIEPLRRVVPYILYHQEHYDGKGYPEGLKGEEIPLGARIVAVADSYDAMTTTRPYRQGKSQAEAIAELRKCAGSQFDPVVVEAFVSLLTEQERMNNQTGS